MKAWHESCSFLALHMPHTLHVSSTPRLAMRPMLQHASRSLFGHAASLISPKTGKRTFGLLVQSATSSSSVCVRCQFRASPWDSRSPRFQIPSGNSSIYVPNQPFSSSRVLLEKPSDPSQPTKSEAFPQTTPPPLSSEAPLPPKNEPTVSQVPQEDLPSHREGQRWNLSKRLTEIMDDLLPKLAVVTQKVNNYTGTDYSGIEALRRAIKEQGTVF